MSSVFALHDHATLGDGDALGHGLARNVDHVGLPAAGSIWVSFFAAATVFSRAGSAARASRASERARGRGDIGLAHQALADQKGRNAGRGEPREIGRA